MRRPVGRWVCAAAFVLMIMVVLPGSARAALSWSAPLSLHAAKPQGWSGIACPSTSQCTAVGVLLGPPALAVGLSEEVTFDPSSPGGLVAYAIESGPMVS